MRGRGGGLWGVLLAARMLQAALHGTIAGPATASMPWGRRAVQNNCKQHSEQRRLVRAQQWHAMAHLVVGALLDDFALEHHRDAVGVPHGAQPAGWEQGRSVGEGCRRNRWDSSS